MKRLYYKLLRDFTAARILAALVASPERYKYIDGMVLSGKLSNHEATEKNINKALLMANQLVDEIKLNEPNSKHEQMSKDVIES